MKILSNSKKQKGFHEYVIVKKAVEYFKEGKTVNGFDYLNTKTYHWDNVSLIKKSRKHVKALANMYSEMKLRLANLDECDTAKKMLCSVNKKYIRPSQKSTKPSVFLTH